MKTDVNYYSQRELNISQTGMVAYWKQQIICSIRATFVFLLLCGVVYTGLITLLGQALFPYQSSGSLIEKNGKLIGSELIGQHFVSDSYFHGRPTAVGYDPMETGGSNLAPSNPELRERVKQDSIIQQNLNSISTENIPVDLLATSGSGVDPHISLSSAKVQAARISANRQLPLEVVMQVIHEYTESPQWGIFGQERVNVLKLNLALDRLTTRS
ncbi:potassium-transporting ATPase subunit KdpC [Vibrio metschnikovii]|uniref:potassium-transporting ATPase subunit KdpC n=1 Tax=Vibrio metschnikovii TaxID=28172 RepID=UPI001C2FBE5C|nr:potassium-transporting ATPase subunit KdpC [Vibrio metschnikovii]